MNPGTQIVIVDNLANEGFCKDPEVGLDEEQIAYCQTVITAFMPAAITDLFTNLAANADSVCSSVYDGVCDSK